ncbi:MAG TPA: hypothetical protein VNY78_09425 [Edaphobacter sp.]|nr:hypothetical protein [Edaphobacter sp.]
MSRFGRNDDSLVLDRFLVRSYGVEIRVEKDRTAVDGRDFRDSSPFDFAQGQNDGKDLWRLTAKTFSGKNNAETKARATAKTRQWLGCCLGREADFSTALLTKA